MAKMDVSPAELKLARQLVEQQEVSTYNPEVFKDEVQSRVMAAIDAKVQGKVLPVTKTKPKQNLDLMAALKASLDKQVSAPKKSRKGEVEVRP